MSSENGENAIDIAAVMKRVESDVDLLASVVRAQLGETALIISASELIDLAPRLERVAEIADSVAEEISEADLDTFEEDETLTEDEVYEIVTRFVNRQASAPFTIDDLADHLYNLGYRVPEDSRELKTLFVNWMNDILADKKERGEKVKFVDDVKVPGEPGKKYAFAEIVGAKTDLVEETTQPLEPLITPSIEQPLPTRDTLKPALTQEIVNSLVASNLKLKASRVSEMLANQLGVSVEEVTGELNRLVQEGKLFKVRRQGTGYWSLEKPERKGRVGRTYESTSQRIERPLSKKEIDVASAMIMVLAAPGRHVNQRMTAVEIAREIENNFLVEGAVKPGLVTRLARRLAKQNITTHGKSKVQSKSPHARSKEAFKIGLSSQEIRETLKYPDRTQEILDLIKSGELYQVAE